MAFTRVELLIVWTEIDTHLSSKRFSHAVHHIEYYSNTLFSKYKLAPRKSNYNNTVSILLRVWFQ